MNFTKAEKIKNIAVVVTVAVFVLLCSLGLLLLPKESFSESERRSLATLPELNVDNILSGKYANEFETYTLDHFPLRDEFRTLKAVTENYVFAKKDNGGLYISGGYISKLEYPMDDEMIDYAGDKFVSIKEKYFPDSDRVYLSIVPDKNKFLAESGGYLSIDYDKLVSDIREKTDAADIEYIDIFPLLSIEDYYRTDTHWREEKITDVADRILETMGASPTGEFTAKESEYPFYGVYHGQAALPVEPDTLKYLTNDVLDACKVEVVGAKGNGTDRIYNLTKASGRDPYEVFLSGAQAIITIENPSYEGEDARELVVFRDSFGSSLAPLLTGSYSKVTLVDIRYIDSSFLSNYVDFEGADILFVYSTIVLNTAKILK